MGEGPRAGAAARADRRQLRPAALGAGNNAAAAPDGIGRPYPAVRTLALPGVLARGGGELEEPFDPLRDEPILARTVFTKTEMFMDQTEDPRELERKIERANRIASRVTDQTTSELLGAWVKELRQKLRQLLEARRTKHEIKARARELWEQQGCPSGRDVEFWLQAESEIKTRKRQV